MVEDEIDAELDRIAVLVNNVHSANVHPGKASKEQLFRAVELLAELRKLRKTGLGFGFEHQIEDAEKWINGRILELSP